MIHTILTNLHKCGIFGCRQGYLLKNIGCSVALAVATVAGATTFVCILRKAVWLFGFVTFIDRLY